MQGLEGVYERCIKMSDCMCKIGQIKTTTCRENVKVKLDFLLSQVNRQVQ